MERPTTNNSPSFDASKAAIKTRPSGRLCTRGVVEASSDCRAPNSPNNKTNDTTLQRIECVRMARIGLNPKLTRPAASSSTCKRHWATGCLYTWCIQTCFSRHIHIFSQHTCTCICFALCLSPSLYIYNKNIYMCIYRERTKHWEG